jgi:hypothetical protein
MIASFPISVVVLIEVDPENLLYQVATADTPSLGLIREHLSVLCGKTEVDADSLRLHGRASQ